MTGDHGARGRRPRRLHAAAPGAPPPPVRRHGERRARCARARPSGQRPLRHRGPPAVAHRGQPLRPDLRRRRPDRADPSPLDLGRRHPTRDRPRRPLRACSGTRPTCIAALAGIPGLAEARRVGTDSLTPVLRPGAGRHRAQASSWPTPRASWPGCGRTRRRTSSPASRRRCTLAEAGLAALDEALEPGVTERDLLGVYVETVAALGAPTPPSESVVFATPRRGPVRYRYLASDRLDQRGRAGRPLPRRPLRRLRGRAWPGPGRPAPRPRRARRPWPTAAAGPSTP